MGRPKIHATTADRNRASQAAFQERKKKMSPLQRLTKVAIYTREEQELADLLRMSILQLETRSAALNAKLQERVAADPNFPKRTEVLFQLREGFTTVQIPWF